uniref:Uncharacterized protein n=1 Tax=Oryza brachyantha TaxID=4533 RepID=J3MHZ6_ORYBR
MKSEKATRMKDMRCSERIKSRVAASRAWLAWKEMMSHVHMLQGPSTAFTTITDPAHAYQGHALHTLPSPCILIISSSLPTPLQLIKPPAYRLSVTY